MVVFPNAKINIGLNIVEKRPDGFHNLESCFYPVGWSDVLEILPATDFAFRSSGVDIPEGGGGNLCQRAYDLVAADYPIEPVDMHLLKCIPVGAGLGGGSADAAFTITALNALFNLNIPEQQQQDYARKLGSDCAFFVQNKAAYCFNKGDEFDKIGLNLAGKWIVLVNPGVHIPTAAAYAGIVPQQSGQDLRTVLLQPIEVWKDQVKNDFEATIFPKYPLLAELKAQLYQFGAQYASMSGSGSTVYGIFEQETNLADEFCDYKVWQGLLA